MNRRAEAKRTRRAAKARRLPGVGAERIRNVRGAFETVLAGFILEPDSPTNPFSIFRHWDHEKPTGPIMEVHLARRKRTPRINVRCAVCRWKGRRAWGWAKPCPKDGGEVGPVGGIYGRQWELWRSCVESRGGELSPGSRPA